MEKKPLDINLFNEDIKQPIKQPEIKPLNINLFNEEIKQPETKPVIQSMFNTETETKTEIKPVVQPINNLFGEIKPHTQKKTIKNLFADLDDDNTNTFRPPAKSLMPNSNRNNLFSNNNNINRMSSKPNENPSKINNLFGEQPKKKSKLDFLYEDDD